MAQLCNAIAVPSTDIEEKFLVPHTGGAVCTVCGAALESWRKNTNSPKRLDTTRREISCHSARHGSRAARSFRRGPSKATGIPRSFAAIPSRWSGRRALDADGPFRRSTARLGLLSPTRDGESRRDKRFSSIDWLKLDRLLETLGPAALAGL